MKKVIFLLAGLFFCATSHAGLLDLPNYTSGNDVSIANLDLTNTTIEDWANGNIEGGTNIKAGSLVSADFSDAVSIIKFRDEAFNDFTYTGMLCATSASLTGTISAGTSYVGGQRIITAATTHVFTASKDTYGYINVGGYFVYEEVANGAAAPSTPSDSLLLFKAVTDGTAITSVTDLRTLSIQITATSSNFPAHYRLGATLSRDTSTTFHFEPGEFAIGNYIYSNAADTSVKTITTTGDWIGGLKPSLTAAIKVYAYAYNSSGTAFDLKFASNDPVYADTSENTGGTLRYYKSGSVYYRALGWLVISADTVQAHHFSNFFDLGVSNNTISELNTLKTVSTGLPVDNSVPTSTEGDEVIRGVIVPSNPNSKIRIRAKSISSPGGAEKSAMSIIGSTTSAIAATVADSTAQPHEMFIEKVITPGTIGFCEYKMRCGRATTNTLYINGDEGGVQLFGGVANTYIELEELGQ